MELKNEGEKKKPAHGEAAGWCPVPGRTKTLWDYLLDQVPLSVSRRKRVYYEWRSMWCCVVAVLCYRDSIMRLFFSCPGILQKLFQRPSRRMARAPWDWKMLSSSLTISLMRSSSKPPEQLIAASPLPPQALHLLSSQCASEASATRRYRVLAACASQAVLALTQRRARPFSLTAAVQVRSSCARLAALPSNRRLMLPSAYFTRHSKAPMSPASAAAAITSRLWWWASPRRFCDDSDAM